MHVVYINICRLSTNKQIIKEIDKMTAMNVLNMEIVVKGVNLEKNDKLDRSK